MASDSKGEVIYYEGFVVEITERIKSQEIINQKINELERFNNITVNREIKMIELKKEINALLVKAGEKPKYRIVK